MSNNKYYDEQILLINSKIEEKKYDEVLKIINEELSMPYIPSGFEKFLINSIEKIPSSNKNNNLILSFEKIIDLLIKFDDLKKNTSDLINNLSKFNLKNQLSEIEYYFSTAKNKRNIATFFELLIINDVDIETPYGNPKNFESILKNNNFLKDVSKTKEILKNNLEIFDVTVELLKDIYLTKHVGEKLEGNYSELAIYTISKIFNDKKIESLITDLKSVKVKMESIKTFDTL